MTDILNLVNSSRWSGELRVITNAGFKSIRFKEGDVYAAKSSAVEDRLGEVAIRAGMLNRAELDEALAKCSDRKRLGALLVDSQLLNTHDLYSLLQKQTEEIFYSLLMEEKAQFFFHTFVAGETLDAETEEQLHEQLSDLLQGQTSDEPIDERDDLDPSGLDGFSDAIEL